MGKRSFTLVKVTFSDFQEMLARKMIFLKQDGSALAVEVGICQPEKNMVCHQVESE